MIRRGNICSTKRASDSNPKQGQNSKMAERMDQTFSVNRLADGPCRQSSFLSVQWCDCSSEKMPHEISRELSSTYRRKRTLALRGRNQRRDTSEQAGKRPLHSVEGFLRRCLHLSRCCRSFICPAHAFKNPRRRPPNDFKSQISDFRPATAKPVPGSR
jgi:hypothetical protein